MGERKWMADGLERFRCGNEARRHGNVAFYKEFPLFGIRKGSQVYFCEKREIKRRISSQVYFRKEWEIGEKKGEKQNKRKKKVELIKNNKNWEEREVTQRKRKREKKKVEFIKTKRVEKEEFFFWITNYFVGVAIYLQWSGWGHSVASGMQKLPKML
jgi:hypothetical protein